MRPEALACVDIGKTNRRVVLLTLEGARVLDSVAEPNQSVAGPYPALDLEGSWRFILAALRRFSERAEVRRIIVATHGAGFVAMAGDAPTLPALDYEHDGPEAIEPEYATLRPDFRESLSPPLPGGLNAGRGLYWLARSFPEAFARTDAILALPQYHAFRLSGVRASEVSSLGSHSDLWAPERGAFSSLVERLGWDRLMPPLIHASGTLGPVRPEVAAATGLPKDCAVLCGVHDSNATLVPHLESERATVFSTGTWIIAFSLGGSTGRLDPARDTLANVDVNGRPVPSARLMGGREFAQLTEADGAGEPRLRDFRPELLPSPGFVPGTGPFGRRRGATPPGWAEATPEARRAAASVYVAFLADEASQLADGAGEIHVEGVFARNAAFMGALTALSDEPVRGGSDVTGTIAGLARLGGLTPPPAPKEAAAEVDEATRRRLRAARLLWRERLDRS